MLLGAALVANAAMLSSSLEAYEITNSLDFSTGWRHDEVENKLHTLASRGGSFVSSDKDKAKELNSWQVGFKGIYAFPGSFCPCGCESFFNNLYLRGSAYWGWGISDDDKFHQTLKSATAPKLINVRGKARNAVTEDYDIALGWLFPVTCDFGIAPVVGYNYDRVQWKIRNNKSDVASFNPSDENGAKITSRFESPYLGVDLGYNWCNWLLTAGYEYHWVTNFRGKFITPGDFVDTKNFLTDYRRGHRGWGNVARVGLNYSCNCWDFGVDFKYRNFRVTHGRDKLPFPAESYGASPVNFKQYTTVKAKWTNYEVKLNLGYIF